MTQAPLQVPPHPTLNLNETLQRLETTSQIKQDKETKQAMQGYVIPHRSLVEEKTVKRLLDNKRENFDVDLVLKDVRKLERLGFSVG